MDPISIILIALFVSLSFLVVVVSSVAFFDGETGVGCMFLVMSIYCIFMAVFITYDKGHKQGQIDAANGKQKYHLTTQPDNSQKWELKKKD
jgi:hypothetical protein